MVHGENAGVANGEKVGARLVRLACSLAMERQGQRRSLQSSVSSMASPYTRHDFREAKKGASRSRPRYLKRPALRLHGRARGVRAHCLDTSACSEVGEN